MNIQKYYEQRRQRSEQAPRYRELCTACLQPAFSCYCQHVRRFDPQIQFIILIHPVEVRRRIATGRMSSLCLENSRLIMGQDYSQNEEVNGILQNPAHHCVILYPGPQAKNLSLMDSEEKRNLFPKDKKLTVFVVDGTWATARRTVRQSANLRALPRIAFAPEKPSAFRVRKQPHPLCYSTIEAIHQTIELVGETQGFDVTSRGHDQLLYVFDKMVQLQLEFIRISEGKPGALRYRRDRKKSA